MNKNIRIILFTITTVFLFFFAGCNDVNNSIRAQNERAHISFAARDAGVGDSQITSSQSLDLNEMDEIILYYDEIGIDQSLMKNKTWTSQDSSSAYQQFTEASLELEYGHYHFILELYKSGEKYLSGEIQDFEVTKDTTKITFQISITYANKELKLYFVDNTKTISKINVKLYSSLPPSSENLLDTQDLSLTDVTGFDDQVFAYEKSGITYEKCFLVYEMYKELVLGYELDPSGNPYQKIENIYLNTIGPVSVEMNNSQIKATINIQSGEINTLPDFAGTFGIYDPQIDIEIIEQSDKFYLNNGSIKFTGHNLTTGKLNGTLSVYLYYNGKEVPYPVQGTDVGLFAYIEDYSEGGSCEFQLLRNKPLLAGGLYQLVIVAQEKVGQSSDYTYYYATKTVDFEVEAKEYYEFNLQSTDYNKDGGWTTLKNNLITVFSSSRRDVELKIYGNAYMKDDYSIGDWWRALRDSLKNSGSCKVDLDMREVGGLIGITDFANDDEYYMLRSLKLPAETFFITQNAFSGQAALQSVYIYCSTPSESMQIAYPEIELDIEEQAFAGLRALQKIEIEKVTPDAPCRYQTYADGKLLVKNVDDKATVIAATPDLKTFDLSTCDNTVTAIGGSAFSGSNIQTLTGTSNLETIGASAFINTASLTSIDLGKVTVVPNSAFYGSGVQTVTANKVTKIEAWGFKNTSSLTTIAMPEVTEIKYDAFYQSGLETITGDPKLEIIGSDAFRETNLTAIPDLSQVTEIDERAFYQCENLETVTIDSDFLDFLISDKVLPEGRQSVDQPFAKCKTQNMLIDIDFEPVLNVSENGGVYKNEYNDEWNKKRDAINSFAILNTLTFNKKVNLPDMGYNTTYPPATNNSTYAAFFNKSAGGSSDNYPGLKKVIFNDESYIGSGQFSSFIWLNEIEFHDESCKSEIARHAFYVYYEDTIKFERSANNIILDGVRKIGEGAINYANKGGTLTIPESVIAIHAKAFLDMPYADELDNKVTVQYEGDCDWVVLAGANATEEVNGNQITYDTADRKISEWLNEKPTQCPVLNTEASPKIYIMQDGLIPTMKDLCPYSYIVYKNEG